MTQIAQCLARIVRPRLLLVAARAGQADYRRSPALLRLLALAPGQAEDAAVLRRLMSVEAQEEARRQAGDAGYSTLRHVRLLIALLAEARQATTTEPGRAATAAAATGIGLAAAPAMQRAVTGPAGMAQGRPGTAPAVRRAGTQAPRRLVPPGGTAPAVSSIPPHTAR